MPKTNAPLSGVKVLDLSRLLPGPYCSWMLDSLGADVIRVEPPGGGDYTRTLPPMVCGHGVFYASLNRGKRSVALELRSAAGLVAFHRMLEGADVLLEGFRPGSLKAAGLDPRQLLERYPELVIASISGFGQTGPLAQEPGHDLNYQGYAGLTAAASGLQPSVFQVADLAGGSLMAALGICAALLSVARGGAGRWLDISMTDGALALLAPQLAVASAEGRDLRPSGELLTGGAAFYQCYRCRDGRLLTVAPIEPKFWTRLRACVPEAPEQATVEGLTALFVTQDRDWWVERIQAACVGPALGAKELPTHPLHVARRRFEQVLGVPMARSPFPWSSAPTVARLGENTREVLEPLGVDVDALITAGLAQE